MNVYIHILEASLYSTHAQGDQNFFLPEFQVVSPAFSLKTQ